ncbi:hypothetical protein CPG37_13440 [Malaciobacter canalis]|uniref:Uncharacterized protein n=1 Tax=Malaciobacter canalis TaxID=1912871 RepID=A0ABX4LLI3_9BACT|nr:hypothetical protein [Malaciobacter canalis]PHO08645.1 hypothetical protein CPG37_13440 [Malaciobacter canalis]QEE32838.1 putative membrane protein [Malaciobacter canalis]
MKISEKKISYYINFLVFLTISINSFYAYSFIDKFFYTTNDKNFEILISAISLEIAWISIFVWFSFRPKERKDILILTIIPMIISNTLTNLTLAQMQIYTNILFLFLFSSLYLIGYFLLRFSNKEYFYDS